MSYNAQEDREVFSQNFSLTLSEVSCSLIFCSHPITLRRGIIDLIYHQHPPLPLLKEDIEEGRKFPKRTLRQKPIQSWNYRIIRKFS